MIVKSLAQFLRSETGHCLMGRNGFGETNSQFLAEINTYICEGMNGLIHLAYLLSLFLTYTVILCN